MDDFKGKDGEVNDVDRDDGEVKFLPFAGLITRALMPPFPILSPTSITFIPGSFTQTLLCIYFCFLFLGLEIRIQNGIIGYKSFLTFPSNWEACREIYFGAKLDESVTCIKGG